MLYVTSYDSPLGKLHIASDGEAICQVSFDSIDEEHIVCDNLAIFNRVKRWLDGYFRGLNPEIDFKLNPKGSKFRMKVWRILFNIPYGETLTYGEIASMISDNMAAQAVGGAVGANPIAIIIPCHRVLGKNGKLTGYAAGLDRKIELLKIENILK